MIRYLFCRHTWWIEQSTVDPMEKPGTFSNYVNEIYNCECLHCGKKQKIIKSVMVPGRSYSAFAMASISNDERRTHG